MNANAVNVYSQSQMLDYDNQIEDKHLNHVAGVMATFNFFFCFLIYFSVLFSKIKHHVCQNQTKQNKKQYCLHVLGVHDVIQCDFNI